MSELQQLVYGTDMNDKAFDDIRSLLQGNNRATNKNGIERDGFILLQAKLCSNLKQEVVWKMLKGTSFNMKVFS